MESSEQPSRVRVGKATREERRPAKIDGTIITQPHDAGFVLEVGNTGLKLNFFGDMKDSLPDNEPYDILGDFMPGSYTEAVPNGSKIFAYGLKHLRDYLKSNAEIDVGRLSKVEGITNQQFRGFLERFFRQSEGVFSINDNNVEIDLPKLVALPDQDPVIRKIERMSRMAEGLVFDASQPVNFT